MSSFPAAAGRALAVQVTRTRQTDPLQAQIDDLTVKLAKAERERDAALKENTRLAAENELLRGVAIHSATVNGAEAGTFVNGRLVVNQVEAAKRLNVKQYQISRWLKAGKFQKVEVPGHKLPGIYADSLHKPERGQPGRKKKH